MTVEQAADWIRENLPIKTEHTHSVSGQKHDIPPDNVFVEHDTGDGSDCSICGRPHAPTIEYHPVESLAEQYKDAILNGDVESEAEERGLGHERFFDQS